MPLDFPDSHMGPRDRILLDYTLIHTRVFVPQSFHQAANDTWLPVDVGRTVHEAELQLKLLYQL